MGIAFDYVEDEGGAGKYLKAPGIYHMVLTESDENPPKKDGTVMDALKNTFVVLSGTTPGQKDKIFELLMWNISEDDAEGDVKKKNIKTSNLCRSLSVFSGLNIQPGQKATVEFVKLTQDENGDSVRESVYAGRQVVMKIGHGRKKNEQTQQWEDDTESVSLAYAEIHHVDDPWVAKNNVPLDQESIALIPKALRNLEKPAPSLVDVAASAASAAPASTPAASAVDVGDV